MNWCTLDLTADEQSRHGFTTVTLAQPRVVAHIRERARRALNVAVALLGILLTAPLMLVIAILVRVTSRGPVLFTQKRVGLNRRGSAFRRPTAGARSESENDGSCRRSHDRGGYLFTMYKFRTMYVGAEDAGEMWARPGDPRITPLGRVLRKTRLDELPQLFNVLKGDMNVVGPRPEQPEIFLSLREKVNGYSERQKVLPGITGLAQVRRPYDQSIGDVRKKVKLDLYYLERRSPATDVRIMLETIPVMLRKDGSL